MKNTFHKKTTFLQNIFEKKNNHISTKHIFFKFTVNIENLAVFIGKFSIFTVQ